MTTMQTIETATPAAGIRAIIRAARVALPLGEMPVLPVRAFAAEVCTAEVTHARSDFWSIVHRIKAAPCFDIYAEPDCDAAFRLSHETHAGAALNWLSHLQAHDSDRRGPWARWAAMSIEAKRVWLRRRRYLLGGLLRAVAAYRTARVA